MGLNALLVCLFEESEALEHLAFKLEQEQLVLMAGKPRLLARNSAEFEQAVKALAVVSRRREELVVSAARRARLGPTTTLGALAEATSDERRTSGARASGDGSCGRRWPGSTSCAPRTARSWPGTWPPPPMRWRCSVKAPRTTAMAPRRHAGANRPRMLDARA